MVDASGTRSINVGTGTRTWDGGEGDDVIWGPASASGDVKLLGGNGSDTIYAPFNFIPVDGRSQVAAGGGGKDVIRFDYYDDFGL